MPISDDATLEESFTKNTVDKPASATAHYGIVNSSSGHTQFLVSHNDNK